MTNDTCRECESPPKVKGFCQRHYDQKKYYAKRGTVRKRTERGEPLAFLRTSMDHEGDECLIWPYFRNDEGYAKVRYEGETVAAHRVICEWANGPAPADDSCALHTCGKGHLGCISRHHLRWGTKHENALDRTAHGTEICGQQVWSARLTPNDVAAIIARVNGGERQSDVARSLGIHPSHVSKIMAGRRWRLGLEREAG